MVTAPWAAEATVAAYLAKTPVGAGRVTAIAYGALPVALPDLVSYAFYRLECSIRSARRWVGR